VTIENIRKARDSRSEPVATAPVTPATPIKRPCGRPPGARNRPRPGETQPLPAAMRIPDAARYVGLSGSMVKKLIRQGKVSSVTIGRTRLVLVSSLNALLGA
jgi:excisionase family DNA binding protein